MIDVDSILSNPDFQKVRLIVKREMEAVHQFRLSKGVYIRPASPSEITQEALCVYARLQEEKHFGLAEQWRSFRVEREDSSHEAVA